MLLFESDETSATFTVYLAGVNSQSNMKID